MLRIFLLFILVFQLNINLKSQDVLVLKNGTVINGKINSIDSSGVQIYTYGKYTRDKVFASIDIIREIRINNISYDISNLTATELNNLLKPQYTYQDSCTFEKKTGIYLDLIIPSLGFEANIYKNQTLYVCIQPEILWGPLVEKMDKSAFITQYLIAYRNYYNVYSRKSRHLNTRNFSANYGSIGFAYSKPSVLKKEHITVFASIGFQRSYRFLHFSAEFGPELILASKRVDHPVTIYTNLKMGIVL